MMSQVIYRKLLDRQEVTENEMDEGTKSDQVFYLKRMLKEGWRFDKDRLVYKC